MGQYCNQNTQVGCSPAFKSQHEGCGRMSMWYPITVESKLCILQNTRNYVSLYKPM